MFHHRIYSFLRGLDTQHFMGPWLSLNCLTEIRGGGLGSPALRKISDTEIRLLMEGYAMVRQTFKVITGDRIDVDEQ